MSIVKNSESSRKIDCVINTVETASRLIIQAIDTLEIFDFKAASGKAVFLPVFSAGHGLLSERAVSYLFSEKLCSNN